MFNRYLDSLKRRVNAPEETIYSCANCGNEVNGQDSLCPNCGQGLDTVSGNPDAILVLIQNLGVRGEKMLQNNRSSAEEILVKLKGSFGEAFVITDRRLYLMKWGFKTGQTLGSRCVAFEFGNITGIEIKKNVMTGAVEILSPATQKTKIGYWGQGENSAVKSDNVVTFQNTRFKHFQHAVNIARELIADYHNPDDKRSSETDNSDYIAELERLAKLKEKGIVTEEEFAAKKKKLLGL